MKKLGLLFILILGMLMSISGCTPKKPIPIGLCITVTDADGYPLQHGITIRNGFELAIDEINASGGIDGRLLETIVLDDQDSLDTAKENIDILGDMGVQYVVGFATSKMMPAIEYGVETYDMLFISPSMSSLLFEGIDDNFLRVYESDTMEIDLMLKLATEKLNLKNIAIVYDGENANYTLPYFELFKEGIEEKGGDLAYAQEYSDPKKLLETVANKLKSSGADGILVIADSGDVIDIAQELNREEIDVAILASGWAMTVDLPMLGGKTVENVYGIRGFKENLQRASFIEFQENYRKAYEEEMTQFSVTGYMAVKLFEHGLKNADFKDVALVKQAILDQETFDGIIGEMKIDVYGDVEQTKFIFTIRDGKYMEVK